MENLQKYITRYADTLRANKGRKLQAGVVETTYGEDDEVIWSY